MSRTRRGAALKSIGRKKITFHLDQLVYLSNVSEDDGFAYFCEMAESQVRMFGTGVVCGHSEIGFDTQEKAEEAALEHLVQMHLAMGGERRPKHRGRERRERNIAAWNARHGRAPLTSVDAGEDSTPDD